jgi:general secretion pathway protein A
MTDQSGRACSPDFPPSLRNSKEATVSSWQYWNLAASPWVHCPPKQLFRSAGVEEALARIDFLIRERRQMAILSGPNGIGKSKLLAYLHAQPPRLDGRPAARVSRLSLMGLAPQELPTRILESIAGRVPRGERTPWSEMGDHFAALARTDSQLLLLLDDVESCGLQCEDALIRLAGLAEAAPITLVLAVESQWGVAISEWLSSRSSLRIELTTWSCEETASFLTSSLAQAGRSGRVFTAAAIARLHSISGGIPRKIAQLADLAMIAAAVQRQEQVGPDLLSQVAAELPGARHYAA